MIGGIKDLGQNVKGYGDRFDRETFYDPETGGVLNLPVPGTRGGIFGDEGLELAMFGEDGMIFDPTDPIDYGILALAATGIGIPAAIGIKALTTGNKIRKIASKAGNVVDRAYIPRETNTIGGKAKNFGRFVAAEETVGFPSTVKDVRELRKIIEENKKKELEARGEFIVTPKKDGGIIEGIQSFKLGSAVKQTGKKILKESDKKTDTKKTGTQTADAVDEGTGAGADAEQTSKNIFQRNPVKTTAAAGVATITASSLFFGDDDEEKTIPNTNIRYTDMLDAGKTTVEDEPDTVGEFMREILINDYGYERNAQGGVGAKIDPKTGDTIREKPTFGEYVKSFGKAYGQRVASDPEFAKKMLAGFSAMMMPREGFVPLSPLGIPEFTTAYLAQDQAIEANKGATQKLLEAIKGDQELKDLYVAGKLADAGVNLNQLNSDKISETYMRKTISEAERLGIDPKDVQLGFIDANGDFNPIDDTQLASLAGNDVSILARLEGRPRPGTTPD
tara:strand:- start:1017 stop:2531 length:1515 start_codon:yes stop_codon:yes gene_type:complete